MRFLKCTHTPICLGGDPDVGILTEVCEEPFRDIATRAEGLMLASPRGQGHRASVTDALSTPGQDLKDYMRQAGEVTYADAHKHHRGEGYVKALGSYRRCRNENHAWVF